ncbi:U3 small nucleolar ribonucleoprotein complex-associated protein, putative [Eimeria tenella]|uniref:U3 small nucleolar ribonucleoprotein complex-associated protein, putative n=1 Tax=Eimeria tenella TaxID=5802 RepID=U6L3X7_EIMTE|nr:U3 small nucleolar ribonucleoprotein complex-associated protein, putative [Eimeria tenella]CDJ43329.1 U3 small nucleolar ribonucleoprotein complex-associated protein, putative [Eimeria tenella]|eukprot:XP_013234079.1 U3 small nucleolar ribonucleoprotein complex-associated protein, putative [Eimeria tenella]
MNTRRRLRPAGPDTRRSSRFLHSSSSSAAKRSRGGADGRGEDPSGPPAAARKRPRFEDENIESDSASGVESPPQTDSESEDGAAAGETADEARLRVARAYLRELSAAAAAGAAAGQPREKDFAGFSTESQGLEADPAFGSASSSSSSSESEGPRGPPEDSEEEDLFDSETEKEKLVETLKSRKQQQKASFRCVAQGLCLRDLGFFKGHKLPVTSVALPGLGGPPRCAYTGGKDCCILRWDLQTGQKDIFKGCRNACAFELRGHRGPVTGLSLNGGPLGAPDEDSPLLSCSEDKSIKSWNLNCRLVSNQFYGHTAAVNCIDTMQPNKPLTGGSDGTLRAWKLVQDTHRAFPSLGSCVDSVACLSPSLFACGAQGGLLALFSSSSRRPLACVRAGRPGVCTPQQQQLGVSTPQQQQQPGLAKPQQPPGVSAPQQQQAVCTPQQQPGVCTPQQQQQQQQQPGVCTPQRPLRATGNPTGVSALCALPGTDGLLVGTEAGTLQLWEAAQGQKGGVLRAVEAAGVAVGGSVAGVALSAAGDFAVAAVSSESRLGRFFKSDGAKNGIRLLRLEAS